MNFNVDKETCNDWMKEEEKKGNLIKIHNKIKKRIAQNTSKQTWDMLTTKELNITGDKGSWSGEVDWVWKVNWVLCKLRNSTKFKIVLKALPSLKKAI